MDLLFYLALVPALGLAAQWIAWRTKLPGILLLLVFGMLLGRWVQPDALLVELSGGDQSVGPRILFPIVTLCVAVIMLEGGLSLKLSELRESGTAVIRLCTIGALVTMLGAALAANQILGFSWRPSILLGAILIVTGPTVIGPLLRQVRPSRRVASTLKWEGIVIDPIGAVLAVLVFEQLMISPEDAGLGGAIWMLAETLFTGVALGISGGIALAFVFRKYLVPDNLHGVLALSLGLLLFAVSDHFAHESGLITVTVLGVWLANARGFDIEHVIEFKENLRTLLIGCLFIVLGSRIELADITGVGWPGIAFVVVLVLLVRPVSVFVALLGNSHTWREKAFIAGLAPRGIVAAAVSSVFALKLEQHSDAVRLAEVNQLATVTFLVIVGTVAIYGVAASPLARWLGLADRSSEGVLIAGADAWTRDFASELQGAGVTVLLVDTNYNKISQARIDGLEAVCANILNEHAREELSLAGIGKMMAVTQNDEVNSLAVQECKNLFDRANLYQLPFDAENRHYRRGLTSNLMGRQLFSAGFTFQAIVEMHQAGAVFKRTRLSESFSYEDYLAKYQDSSMLLGLLKDDGSLWINTVDDPLTPSADQTIIAMIQSGGLSAENAASGDQASDEQAVG